MATPATDDQQMVLLLHWWLTERREALGYSWDDLARLTGTLPDTVEQWAAGEGLPDYPQLKALAQYLGDPDHPPGAEPLPDTEVGLHDFVIAGNGLGIGKCVSLENGTATVEYFDTIARRETREEPTARLRVVRLANQTRCYVFDPEAERWHMGRVRRLGDGDRMIELPDQEVEDPGQEHLYVRWARPVEDPTETLKQKGHETVFFRNQRAPFVRALLRQRTASHGASGLLSSSIELYPHQVEIMRQMLEDPAPRYLLADEAGLGKSVEAGVVIRQFLIDHDAGHVQICAPAEQHAAWEHALDAMFDTEALRGTVSVDPLSAVSGTEANLLVVDDADRVAAWAQTDPDAFASAAAAIHAAPRLLLLSDATPHHAEQPFLALLHLLDPDTYPLDATEAFTARREARASWSKVLHDLSATASEEALRRACTRICEAHPSDDELHACATALQEALDDPDAEPTNGAIDHVRILLKNRYRWHPHMLRTRRADVADVDAVRQAPEYAEFGMDLREETVHALLDAWRTEIYETALADAEAPAMPYARILQTLVETAGSDLSLFAKAVAYRHSGAESDRLNGDLTAPERRRLRETPLSEDEEALLHDMETAARAAVDDMDLSHADWLAAFLDQKMDADAAVPEAFVVHTRYPSVAARLHEQLTDRFGYAATALYHANEDVAMAQDEVRRLLEEDACRILICDRSGVGAIDLSFVDHLIHYDLPWDARQIEARTGGLDRVGRRGRPLHTHVYLGPDVEGSLFEAWYRLVQEGLGVLDTSVAPVQPWLTQIQPDLIETLLAKGTADIDERVQALHDARTRTHERTAQEALFEQPEALASGDTPYFESVEALEADSRALYRDMDAWITKALRFHRSKRGYPDDILRYQPDFNGKTLIPFDTILNRFLPKSDKPTTYHRPVALQSQARADVTANLFRVGHPFLDALTDYFEWDDRGRAYAIWRTNRQWNLLGRDDALFFRFEFVVEANAAHLSEAGAPPARAALQRRANAVFPPQFVTICTTATGEVVDNEGLRSLLEAEPERQQDGGSDTNIKGDRLPALDAFVDPNRWATRCDDARDAARRALRSGDRLVERQERAKQELQAQASPEIAATLRESIADPAVRLDSVGAIVLSGGPLPIDEEGAA